VTVDPAKAARLRVLGRKLRETTAERDEAVRDAAAGGMTYREIAEAVGLSHTAVMFIVRGRTR
jgi:DNA invertase Pin-like site-specific DNA recombinase